MGQAVHQWNVCCNAGTILLVVWTTIAKEERLDSHVECGSDREQLCGCFER
jgi:hypothetical protein